MKKRAGMLFVLCMLVVALLGCSQAYGSEIPTIDRIREAGVLRAGVSLGGPPIGFRDDRGTPMGYDVDWATRMAEILGVEVEFVDVDGDTRISALVSGRVDVVFANMTGNLARAQIINFSMPYLRTGIKMLVRAGSTYYDLEDLNDPSVRIVVGRGSTGEDMALEHAPNAEIIYVPNFTDQVLQLTQGRADVAFEDNTLVDYAAGQSNGALIARDKMYTSDPICVGVPKGDPDFLRWVDMFVSWQISQGFQAATYEKWWGVPPGDMGLGSVW